jgi:hypothetical protein
MISLFSDLTSLLSRPGGPPGWRRRRRLAFDERPNRLARVAATSVALHDCAFDVLLPPAENIIRRFSLRIRATRL